MHAYQTSFTYMCLSSNCCCLLLLLLLLTACWFLLRCRWCRSAQAGVHHHTGSSVGRAELLRDRRRSALHQLHQHRYDLTNSNLLCLCCVLLYAAGLARGFLSKGAKANL
jgi:hypothetical protein